MARKLVNEADYLLDDPSRCEETWAANADRLALMRFHIIAALRVSGYLTLKDGYCGDSLTYYFLRDALVACIRWIDGGRKTTGTEKDDMERRVAELLGPFMASEHARHMAVMEELDREDTAQAFLDRGGLEVAEKVAQVRTGGEP